MMGFRITGLAPEPFAGLFDLDDASLVEGLDLASEATRIFTNSAVAYAHVHFALRGCYAARLDRV